MADEAKSWRDLEDMLFSGEEIPEPDAPETPQAMETYDENGELVLDAAEAPAKADATKAKEPAAEDEFVPAGYLKAERERLAKQAEENAKLQAELDAVRALKAEQEAAAKAQDAQTQEAKLAEIDLSALEEDFPDMVAAIKAQRAEQDREAARIRAELDELKKAIDPIRQQAQAAEEKAQQELQASIAATIDQFPVLRYAVDAQDTNPELLAKATRIENALRMLPEYEDEPADSAKVLKAVAEKLGHVELPPEYQTKAQKQAKSKSALAAAEQAAREAGTWTPSRISDLDGGMAPDSEEINLGALNEHQLAERYARMSPEQQRRLLQRVA